MYFPLLELHGWGKNPLTAEDDLFRGSLIIVQNPHFRKP